MKDSRRGGPLVSVVTSVYNGEAELPATLQSVLYQQGVDFEFIVVDDGSTDGSLDVLEQFARRDSRIRILRQENQGLTRALIRGCAEARGKFIARQDVGDVSLPGRFVRQSALLEARPDVVLTGGNYRMVTECGDILHEGLSGDALDGSAMSACLRRAGDDVYGPHHGTVMFRRDAYEKVGGYRADFYYAQDIDLWLRLVELGEIAIISELCCEILFATDSLSGLNSGEQRRLKRLAVKATRVRQQGESEGNVLERAGTVRPVQASPRERRRRRAAGAYFIGGVLADRGDRAAKRYFRQAVRENPRLLRAWIKLGRSWLM